MAEPRSEWGSGRDSGERVALNTVSAWLANGVGMVVGFFLTRFLLDQLGERLYGLYSLGASVGAWSTFAGVPIGTYAARYATEHLERGESDALDRTLSTSLALGLAVTLVLALFVLAMAAGVRELLQVPDDLVSAARAAVVIVGLASVATVVVRVWEAPVFMTRRFYLKNLAETASRLLGAGLVVSYFLLVGPSVTVWLLVVVALPLVLSLAFVVPAARRGLPVHIGAVSWDRAELARAIPFVLLLAAASIGSLLFDNTDALLIGGMPELGLTQVAAYDLGARWQRQIRPIVEAFVLALSPALVSLVARADRGALDREVTVRTRQALLLTMLPVVGLASVAEPFVTHWVGSQFVDRSVPVMWVTLASTLLWAPGIYASRLMMATARLRLATAGGVAAGVLNLLLSIAFVRYFGMGLLGVAVGTLVAVVLWSNVFMAFMVRRVTRLTLGTYLWQSWARPLVTLPVLLLVGRGLVRLLPPPNLIATLAELALLGIVFAGIAFLLGLPPDERVAVRDQLSRRLRWLREVSSSGRGPRAPG